MTLFFENCTYIVHMHIAVGSSQWYILILCTIKAVF